MPGLNQMTSVSSDGSSIITLQFALNLNIDVAEQEVQAAINAAQTFLPPDLPAPPIYSKSNPADAPVMTLAVTSKTFPLARVEDLADTRLAQKISQLSGRRARQHQRRTKASCARSGESDRAVIVRNQSRRPSHDLEQASINQAKGNFDGPHQAYQINANDQILTSKDYSR